MSVADQPGQLETRLRARQLGIEIGKLRPGHWNAITDVPGVRVGHTTVIEGEGRLQVGVGPVRTGVTVVVPSDDIRHDALFAGYHVLNGCGEMTGTHWIAESGQLSSPIAITNTYSVGVVHDALIELDRPPVLPVVAETWDGWLNDIRGMHVRKEHASAAFHSASSGPVAEGNVGGGTGMICHGFKGGIGTASRVLAGRPGGWVVGVLVQANHGDRSQLRVNGAPVGAEIPHEVIPQPAYALGELPGSSSIIAVVATNAPLLPHQCRRLAQRAAIGIGRAGGLGENTSGDISIAFSTANRGLSRAKKPGGTVMVEMLTDSSIDDLFEAVADSTEEAILNALCAARTMSGVDGRTVYALPQDRLVEVMKKYNKLGSA